MEKKSKEISIGERIREVFDKQNMTITQFAQLLDYDRTNVNNRV
jgi:plasmid maintenance system antidote protein VapI